MNILVTGANGQLGQTFQKEIAPKYSELDFNFKDRNELDIISQEELSSVFSERKYQFCINCAAYTNVELAEEDIEGSNKINGTAVKNLAEICVKNNTVLVHISTDYVFDGKNTEPYSESDVTNPINQYGKSKLRGELLIQELMNRYYIIRSSWLYSPYGKNFVKFIVSSIKARKPLQILDSQIGTPTSCNDLGEFVVHLIKLGSADYGIYHYSATGRTSWYGLAKRISTHFPNLEDTLIKPSEFYATKAERPLFSVLDVTKAAKIKPLKPWESSVDLVVQKLRQM